MPSTTVATAARHRHRAPRRRAPSRLPIVLMALLGIGVLLYPAGARWISDRAHGAAIAGFVHDVQSLPVPERRAELARAREYNQRLPGVALGDPYASGEGMDRSAPGVREYLDELDATSLLGRLRVPRIGLDLPIYHGTATTTLDRGVGHLFGSSLPVGGAGTHAVLTGHSGQPRARLFDRLHELEVGDTFTVTVLDEVLTYRVDQVLVVEPDDTRSLRVTAGEDRVTLVTCTPIGVNSHRLLVRGERVDTAAEAVREPAVRGATAPGLPWWALALGSATVVVGVLARRHARRPEPSPEDRRRA